MSKSLKTVPVKKLVTRGGKTFVTTVYINPEEESVLKKKTSKSTKDIHQKDGKYTSERASLHERIVSNVVNSCPKPTKGEKPTAILLLGGAASGKSTVVNKNIKPIVGTDFGTINADDIKESIPEYRDMMKEDVKTAAHRVHKESSEISKFATNEIIQDGRNFIYDGVLGDEDKAKDLIKKLKSKGYNVKLVGVNVDAEEALGRAELRAFGNEEGKSGSGRYVPGNVLLEGHKNSTSVFEKIKGLVDNVELYDNNVKWGDTPIKVLENNKVYDKGRYETFKKKAEIDPKKIMSSRNKDNINKALDFIGLNNKKEDIIEKSNLTVSSSDYVGCDIEKGIQNDI